MLGYLRLSISRSRPYRHRGRNRPEDLTRSHASGSSNITVCCRTDTPVASIECTFRYKAGTAEVRVSTMSSAMQSESSADSLNLLVEAPIVRRADLKNDRYPDGLSSVGKRAIALVRFLITFCIGVAATLAWQSYGDPIARSYLPLNWLAPQAEPVPQNAPDAIGPALRTASSPDQQQPSAISLDLDAVGQDTDRIAATTASSQEQMTSSADRIATSQEQMMRSLNRIATSQEQMMRSLDQFTADKQNTTKSLSSRLRST
jgi:hypothetical protein